MTKIYNIDPVLVDVPMPIMTPRLMLRPPQAGDGAACFEAKEASWPELTKWMEWAEKPEEHSIEKDEIKCRQKQAAYLLREDLMLFAFSKESGRFIASTGLHGPNWKMRIFEIGYWVRSDETGKGYATEITNALVQYAFKALHANVVTIGHAKENEASKKIITKLKFNHHANRNFGHILPGGIISSDSIYIRENLNSLPDLDVQWGNEI